MPTFLFGLGCYLLGVWLGGLHPTCPWLAFALGICALLGAMIAP